MKSLDLAVGVIASHGTIYDAYKEEWIRYITSVALPNVHVFFLYNDHSLNEPFNINSYNFYSDITFKYSESVIPGMIQKTIGFFDYINVNYDYKFMLRCNLSSFYNFNRLLDVLNTVPSENLVFSRIMPHPIISFPSGCGFVYSKNIVDKVLNYAKINEDILNSDYEDLVFAKILIALSLKHNKINMINYEFVNLTGESDLTRRKRLRNIEHFHYRTKYQHDSNSLLGVEDFKFLVNKNTNMHYKSNVIAFVCNVDYLEHLHQILRQLSQNGKWTGDVLLLHDDTISDSIIEHFKRETLLTHSYLIDNPVDAEYIMAKCKENNVAKSKIFQYAKLHLFNSFMKCWNHVLYIDANMTIDGDINRFFEIECDNKTLYAHCNGYPTYEWKLKGQFELAKDMESKYDLDINYFQSGVLYYSTSIIEDNTFNSLVDLANEYYHGYNDQAIMNLEFTCNRNIWKQLPLCDNKGHLYDAVKRCNASYVIYKWSIFST